MDVEKILALLKEMERRQVDYVLVGGVAMGLHGLVRATEDVGLFVRPEPDNVRRVKDALRAVWDDPDIDQIEAGDLSGEYATVRYGPPEGSFAVDLVSRLGSAFTFDDLQAETIVLEGLHVRLATPETLYRMKRDTVRPIDLADAAALREKFGLQGE